MAPIGNPAVANLAMPSRPRLNAILHGHGGVKRQSGRRFACLKSSSFHLITPTFCVQALAAGIGKSRVKLALQGLGAAGK